MTNPYSNARPYQMWRKAVSRIDPHLLDPVVNPRFQMTQHTRVATAGSCFAQHIARELEAVGFNYFVPEGGDTLSQEERRTRQFGVFSARYGNVYTATQLLQLFEEVFDSREMAETSWRRPDGRFVDPYRPQVEPSGFASAAEVNDARKAHLKHVRRVFLESEVFIFTLGLTESWRSRIDGAVFPLAPGVVADEFDENRHEFQNFSVRETTEALDHVLRRLKEVNPGIKVLLTVSPVPLIATYESRHVLVSTTYSKAVLRIAAQAIVDALSWVDYFPSYEIITGSSTGGMYFEADHREVTQHGVAHAMRCFVNNYLDSASRDVPPPETGAASSIARLHMKQAEVICDEEAIEAVKI